MSSERTSTIVLPLPVDLFKPFLEAGRRDGGGGDST
jgi:hypothetical protein